MKSFKAPWSQQKAQTICTTIKHCASLYIASHLALKIPPLYAQTPAMKQLIREVRALAKAMKIPLHEYTLLVLKNGWTTINQSLNKRKLMEAMLHKYNLVHLYRKELKNRNRYYEMLFEAVGVADLVLRGQEHL